MRDLRTSIGAVVVPAGALVGLAFLATPTAGGYVLGTISGPERPDREDELGAA